MHYINGYFSTDSEWVGYERGWVILAQVCHLPPACIVLKYMYCKLDSHTQIIQQQVYISAAYMSRANSAALSTITKQLLNQTSLSKPGAAQGFFPLKDCLFLPLLHDQGCGSWFLETRLTLDLTKSQCNKVRWVVREPSSLVPGDASFFCN